MVAKLFHIKMRRAAAEEEEATAAAAGNGTTAPAAAPPSAEHLPSSPTAAARRWSSFGGSKRQSLLLSMDEDGTGEDRGGLWHSGGTEKDGDCSSTLRKIFRYTLSQTLGLHQAARDSGNSNKMAEILEKEAKAQIPAAILTLLSRLVDAERAAATPHNSQDQGAGNSGYYTSVSRGIGDFLFSSGKKRRLQQQGDAKKPKRRVSFNTFDLSVVDTPDPQRHGSDRPMEGVLSSLFLALKAAEVLRAECLSTMATGTSTSYENTNSVMMLMAAAAATSTTVPSSGIAGGSSGGNSNNQNRPGGKENEHLQQGQGESSGSTMAGKATTSTNNISSSVPSMESSPVSSSPDSDTTVRMYLQNLVAALGALATHATNIATSSGRRTGRGEGADEELEPSSNNTSIGSNEKDSCLSTVFLGTRPHWPEIAAASSFYHKELHNLCLGSEESLLSSRLLDRYHETLSSLVRYEMKKVLNLCYCEATDFVDSDNEEVCNAGQPAAGGQEQGRRDCHHHHHHHEHNEQHEDDGQMMVPSSQHDHSPAPLPGGQAAEGDGAIHHCCSAMQILVETATNLQYNSDDPAALFHFALRKVNSTKGVWKRFVDVVQQEEEGVGRAGRPIEEGRDEGHQGQDAPGGMPMEECPPHWGEESKGGEGEFNSISAGNFTTVIKAPLMGHEEQEAEEEEDEEEEHEPASQHRRSSTGRRSSVPSAVPNKVDTPRWWATAEAQGQIILSYLGAASFLLRVLQDPFVSQAVTSGRWGRVERLAGMISGVLGVPAEDESLKALQDLLALMQELEEELTLAQHIRGTLLRSTPPEILSAAPSTHYLPVVSRRKRKRAPRQLKENLKNMLIWAQSNEIPADVTYPELIPLCVYSSAPHPFCGDGEEEEEVDGEEGGEMGSGESDDEEEGMVISSGMISQEG